MITNLFSIFDPHTSLNYSLNWLSIFLPLLFIPKIFWFKQNKILIIFNLIIIFLFNELKNLFKKNNYNNIIFFINLFFIFIIINFLGLFPYIFTPSRHLSITLPLSLSIWLRLIIFGWTKKTNSIFAHLVPLGTPSILIPFIVIIESIRNIIRPGTLAIRLSANIIAGHLLFCLLGSTGPNIYLNFIILILLICQIILFILEISVSLIQSYVFITLRSLYSNEI